MKAAEIQIKYSQKPSMQFIQSSYAAYEIFMNSWDMNHIQLIEEFKVMYINNGNRVLGISSISKGGMTSCLVDVRLVLSIALKSAATGIILAHNHPSGKMKPSKADIELTRKIKRGGEMLDINVLDHIIINSSKGYFSFADEGML